MYIKFWGTRGSIPTPLPAESIKEKIRLALEGAAGLDLTNKTVIDRYVNRLPITIQSTIGGNTICLEIRSGDQLLILDAGSGIRLLGIDLMKQAFAQGQQQADILITHTHWDHIQGFPFFQTAFVPNNHFTFHSPFENLKDRLAMQQSDTYFPVPITYLSATLEFKHLKPTIWHQIGKFKICPMLTSHPGEAYIYRIEDGQTSLVYATDSEYKRVDRESTKRYTEFFRETDLLIFDAQYSFEEVLDKPDWGHSTALMGAEFAYRAKAKRLALFHHDPTSPDEKIWAAKEQAEAYLMHQHRHHHHCKVLVAYDGLDLEI
jgi:phosphoribosyl 1,2-cyclic phosphodiesterase